MTSGCFIFICLPRGARVLRVLCADCLRAWLCIGDILRKGWEFRVGRWGDGVLIGDRSLPGSNCA